SSLARTTRPLLPLREKPMLPLGIFGSTVADEVEFAGSELALSGMGGAVGRGGAPMAMLARSAPMEGAEAFGMMADKAMSPEAEGEGGDSAVLVEPSIRSEFADTALWVGSLTTDASGIAQLALTMPEN